jgi:hypothetical protein
VDITPYVESAKKVILLVFPFLGPDEWEWGIGIVFTLVLVIGMAIRYLNNLRTRR